MLACCCSRFYLVICLFLIVVVADRSVRAGSIYSSDDFEPTTFTAGTVNGQNLWSVISASTDDAVITSDFSKYGRQSLYLKNTGAYMVARLTLPNPVATTHYVDTWIYPSRSEFASNNTVFRFRDNSWTIIGYIQITLGGAVTVNGSNNGAKYRFNEWNRITVKLDMVNNVMDVYVNNQLAYTNSAMVSTPVGGIRVYDFDWIGAGTEMGDPSGPHVDGFYISDENPLVFVSNYGATGDGQTDDKPAIQSALNAIKSAPYSDLDNVTLVFDAEQTYMLGHDSGSGGMLWMTYASNFTIEGQNARLLVNSAVPAVSGNGILAFVECQNARLLNMIFDGNRDARTLSSPGQIWAHNVVFEETNDMLIDRVISRNAITDGFYIYTTDHSDPATFPARLHFIRCGADNCFRQGMSIINSDGVVIENSWFHNTHGTPPEAGIDIESNNGSAAPGNRNVVITGCSFTQNAGRGVLISSAAGGCTQITVEKSSFEGNHGPLSVGGSYCKIIGNTIGSNYGYTGTGRVLDLPYTDGANHDNLIADNHFVNLSHLESLDYSSLKLIYVHGGAGERNVIINNAFNNCDLASGDYYIWISGSAPTTTVRDNTKDGAPYP